LFTLRDGNKCPLNGDALADVVGYKLHGKPDAVLIYNSAELTPQVWIFV
jgi:hypothetical protein